jgi:hypothetical protein
MLIYPMKVKNSKLDFGYTTNSETKLDFGYTTNSETKLDFGYTTITHLHICRFVVGLS